MRLTLYSVFFRVALTVMAGLTWVSHGQADQWLGFRGDGTNASEVAGPEKLSAGEDGIAVKWQTEMPGQSVAGPIVVNGTVVTTSSAGQDGEQMFITAVDLATGEIKWEQKFRATGRPFCHPLSANAAPTAVSDGKNIVAFFSSNDLACLDLDGNLKWYRGLTVDHPSLGNDIGMAASPAIVDGTVIVQIEAQGESIAKGILLADGTDRWTIKRPEQSNWSTPVSIQRPDHSTEAVLMSRESVVGINPSTGQTLWTIDEGGSPVSSATPAGDLLLIPGGKLLALDVGSSANMPEEVWRDEKLSPQSASTVVGNGRAYSLKGSVLTAADLKTGEVFWKQRLGKLGGTWATPAMAGSRLYVFDQTGKGLVVDDNGDEAEVVDKIELDDGVLGSPAVVGGRLIVRARKTLYCF